MKKSANTSSALALQSARDIQPVLAEFTAQNSINPASRKVYENNLKQFFAWAAMTGRVVSELSVADIVAYKDGMIGKLSVLTIAGRLNALHRFYNWTAQNNLYPNIAASVRAPAQNYEEYRHTPLSVNNVGKLIECAKNYSKRDYAIIMLMLVTGLRCVEVMRSNVGDITYRGESNARVLNVQGKGHIAKDNFVNLPDLAYNAISDYLQTRKVLRPSDPLFTNVSRDPAHSGGRLTTRAISALCKNALREIGLNSKQFTAHSLRHSAGTNLIRQGGSIQNAQEMLRHVNPSTTEIYIKMALKERRLTEGGEYVLAKLYGQFV